MILTIAMGILLAVVLFIVVGNVLTLAGEDWWWVAGLIAFVAFLALGGR